MRILRKILNELKRLGPMGTLRASFFAVTNPSKLIGWLRGGTDPIEFKFGITECYFPPNFNITDHSSERLLWLIPDASPTSGGHSTIFRFLNGFARLGRHSDVMIVNPNPFVSPIDRQRNLRDWFGFDGVVYYPDGLLPRYSGVVATEWRTAFWTKKLTEEFACAGYYFVQDYEPWFFPSGGNSALAESTYSLGFTGIFAGEWLEEKLLEEFGMKGHSFRFSGEQETDIAVKEPPQNPNLKRIFLYARPPTERRGYELAVLALEELYRRHGDVFEVISAGWTVRSENSFRHLVLGEVDKSVLRWATSIVDAGLVLSFSNVSLLPTQLMFQNVPVVTNKGEWLDWQLGGSRSFMSSANTPESIADELELAIFDKAAREAVVRKAKDYVLDISWDEEVRNIYDRLGFAEK